MGASFNAMYNIQSTEYTDYYEPSIDKVIGESDSIICRPFPSLEVICKRREDSFRAKYYKIKKFLNKKKNLNQFVSMNIN